MIRQGGGGRRHEEKSITRKNEKHKGENSMDRGATLFGELCKESTLFEAWKTVKEKKSSGGIDGVTISEFEVGIEREISELSEALRTGRWEPEPYKSIKIPKKDGEERELGMLSIRDKIVQCAIKGIVEPVFEKIFVNNSYGYRPGKGHAKAVRRALFESGKGENRWVVRLDIDDYFDHIDHDKLAGRLLRLMPEEEEMVRLMMLSMRMGKVDKRLRWNDREAGVPQGAVISPMLSNFYLHPFDEYALTLSASYVRYADDFCLMCSSRGRAIEIMEKVRDYLRKEYGLGLNEPVIIELWRGFEFLGLTISKKGLSLSVKKELDIKERIAAMKLTAEGMTAESARAWEGIRNYYGKLLPENVLVKIDGMLYERVRQWIGEEWSTIGSRSALKRVVEGLGYLSNEYQMHARRVADDYGEAYELARKGQKALTGKERNKRVIERRKEEYRKREGEGSELIVSTYGSYIGITKGCVTVKKDGRLIAKQSAGPLSHIMVIGGGVSLSSNLIEYCMKNMVSVDFFASYGSHIGSLLSNKYIEGTLWNKQAQCGSERRLALAGAMIGAKIGNQFSLVKYFHKYHKTVRATLSERYDDMATFCSQYKILMKATSIESADYIKTIVEQEAQAALKYWAYVRELLADDEVGFERREHKGAKDLVNSMLNYGYAILYSRVWQALLGARLNPYDSIVHARQAGKPTFVYDVVEMFRAQVVDRVVITLIQKKTPLAVDKGLLDAESRRQIAKGVAERLNRYEKYRGEEMTMSKIIREQAGEIADWIDKGKHYRPYMAKW